MLNPPASLAVEQVWRSSTVYGMAAIESRLIECTDLRLNTSRLVKREQKAESHLVATHKGKATQL
jgi:hypothetical protein